MAACDAPPGLSRPGIWPLLATGPALLGVCTVVGRPGLSICFAPALPQEHARVDFSSERNTSSSAAYLPVEVGWGQGRGLG